MTRILNEHLLKSGEGNIKNLEKIKDLRTKENVWYRSLSRLNWSVRHA